MNEKIKENKEKVLEILKKVPKKIYTAIIVLLVVAFVIVIWLNNRPYRVLFTDLNATEVSSILNYMEQNGVTDYKIENNDTILVRENQESGLKSKLLMEGYPQSGFGYTYSTGTGPFSTESERQSAELKDLQDRLGAVIRGIDGVKDATVTINAGEDRRYVLDSNNMIEATASVFLTMADGVKLKDEHAESIRNFIAHSVKGLKIDSVNILDSLGNTYGAGNKATDGESSKLKLQLEEEWENKIRTSVMQVLAPYYGEKNVRVGVNCIVDVSQTVEDNTDVYLPEWAADGSTNGRGIVGSRIFDYVIVDGDGEKEGGTVGTSTNADFPEYVEDMPKLDGNEKEIQASGQVDYENSTSKKHIIRTAGYLTDCTIAVSINSTTAGDVNKDEISRHVAKAAGIKTTNDTEMREKISVMSMPFYESGIELPVNGGILVENWMIYTAIGAGVLLLLILIIVFVIIGKKKKKKEEETEEIDEEYFVENTVIPSETKEQMADIMNPKVEKSVELRKNVRKFAENNPEITAQIVKNWLKGGE